MGRGGYELTPDDVGGGPSGADIAGQPAGQSEESESPFLPSPQDRESGMLRRARSVGDSSSTCCFGARGTNRGRGGDGRPEEQGAGEDGAEGLGAALLPDVALRSDSDILSSQDLQREEGLSTPVSKGEGRGGQWNGVTVMFAVSPVAPLHAPAVFCLWPCSVVDREVTYRCCFINDGQKMSN